MIKQFFNKKGNVTTLWVASLPVFAILFCIIASLASAWMTHSNSQVAADAASIAATKKLEGWVHQDTDAWISIFERQMAGLEPGDPGYTDPYTLAFGSKTQQNRFMNWVISSHEAELKKEVKKYVTKHGGHTEGEIRIGKNGRVEVKAQTQFRSLIFEDVFEDYYISGTGTGPTRYYLKWMTEPRTVKYQ